VLICEEYGGNAHRSCKGIPINSVSDFLCVDFVCVDFVCHTC